MNTDWFVLGEFRTISSLHKFTQRDTSNGQHQQTWKTEKTEREPLLNVVQVWSEYSTDRHKLIDTRILWWNFWPKSTLLAERKSA